jgi:hypothetical protein
MVLIVGWGGGQTQDLGEVAPTVCPNCHNQVFLHYIKSQKAFSVFFVPIVPYGGSAYLACPICKMALPLTDAQLGAVERMRNSTQRFRRRMDSEAAYRVAVERFWGSIGRAPSGSQIFQAAPSIPPPAALAATPPAATPPAAAAAAVAPTLADQLASLAELHADGHLTDDQFETAKRRLLEG